MATAGVNGDSKYVLASLRSARAAGFTPSDTFTHRPFFFRWFMAALDSLTWGSTDTREAVIRAAAVLLCVAAGIGLRAALARRMPVRDATLTAAVVAMALAFAPGVDFLEPEWVATLLGVVAVAVAFAFERRWVGAVAAALPLGLAVMMKYSTAATAAMALIVIFAADRLRAVLLAVTTGLAAAALFGLSVWSGSHELQWARDMPKLNAGAVSRAGLQVSFVLDRSVSYLADRMTLSPLVALVPAALLLYLSRVNGRLRRLELTLLAAAFLIVCIAAVTVQGNWFLYHSATLPVTAAGLWALAVAAWYGAHKRPPVFFTAVTAVYAVWAPFVNHAPQALQGVGVAWCAVGLGFLAGLADLLTVRTRRSGDPLPASRRRWPSAVVMAVAAFAGVACLAVSVWPQSPEMMMKGKVTATNTDVAARNRSTAERAAEINRMIPPGAPVLYLAFGDVAYYVGHPVQCRYPIATVLQRTKFVPDVNQLPSYVENDDCINHDPAKYAILQRSWFSLNRVDPKLTARIKAAYDCPLQPKDGPRRVVVCRLR
ncbi:hypothetical protein ACFWVC_35535 [Streptomyces sp. NPDC058691]|uniref:hypothetical protein n=1 Tax=Streptomyces sp. NPDC058691 TaxID=3346601 RepID=UPI0036565E09